MGAGSVCAGFVDAETAHGEGERASGGLGYAPGTVVAVVDDRRRRKARGVRSEGDGEVNWRGRRATTGRRRRIR